MHSVTKVLGIFTLIVNLAAAEIKVIGTTVTTIEWNLEGSLQAGKKHSVEVLLNTGSGKARVIDEPLPSKKTTYKAINLKPNQIYQLRVYSTGGNSEGELSRPTYTNLRCYSCTGVRSADLCTKVVDCSPNERQCYTRVRYISTSGGRFSISKGCKVSTDVCLPNMERLKIIGEVNAEIGDLTDEEVLNTMPGLKYFGNLEKLFTRSPAILKRVKKKFEENKKNMLQEALKSNCTHRDDPKDFCRCCCNEERCNHGLLDCGLTPPPDVREDEPLPPDIATTTAPKTFPTPPPRKVAPICQDFNGGCDHVCIALNKTTASCECHENYVLQDDGKTCKTHLLHAVADAGPDIEIVLPQNSLTITANRTLGGVKKYKWWAPIAIGENAGLTTSDPTRPDLDVMDLKQGTYKFILMVTGMDGRRTSDMMTLIVKPHPSTVNDTESSTPKPTRPKPRIVGQSRFKSISERKEWKVYVKESNITTPSPAPTSPLLLFRRPSTPKLNILTRSRANKKTTPAPKITKPTKKQTAKPSKRPIKPKGPKKPPPRGGRRPPAGKKTKPKRG